MGMGEPLDNLEAVAGAVAVLTDSCGLRLAARHITISTVGRVDQFPRLAALGLLRVNLAVSLSAPDDALRSRLMPVNRSWDLSALKQALLALPLPRTRRLLISYVLIAGVNDSPAQADALATWLSGLRAQVNLIPLNPIPGSHQRPAADAARELFRTRLLAAGVEVRLRATKGDGVMAACGQLGTARTPKA
jgi:23S rRNA (adenine2503-C2)-methyltransferase